MVFPDGRVMRRSSMEASRPTPPAPPSEAAVSTWIQKHADDLMETINRLVGNDANAKASYEASESGLTLYQKVDRRIRAIFYLLQG